MVSPTCDRRFKELEALMLDRAKSLPLLTADGPWKQTGWGPSLDGSIEELSLPLVSVKLFRLWIKVVQKRANGWDGAALNVATVFDEHATTDAIVDYVMASFAKQVDALAAEKACA